MREHAVPVARGGRHSDRPLRELQRRPREERVPHGPLASVRQADADDLGHPLQLFVARSTLERRLLRVDSQLPAQFVAAALPVRRVAGGLRELRRGPRARAPAALGRHVVPAVRDVAAHGAARLSERRAVLACGELQQPRVLRGVAARGAHPPIPAVRGHRRSRAATTIASSARACCRSRTSSTERSGRSA